MAKMYRQVKVSPETYRELIKSRGMAEAQFGRRVTMDEIIRGLLSQAKEVKVKVL